MEQIIHYYINPQGIEISLNKVMERLALLTFAGNPLCSNVYPFVERATDTQNEDKPMHFSYKDNYIITTPDDNNNFIVFFEKGDTNPLVDGHTQETDVSMICWFYEGLMTNEKRIDIELANYIVRRVLKYLDYYCYDIEIADRDSIWGDFNNESFLVNDAPYNAFRINFTLSSDVPCYLSDDFDLNGLGIGC